MERKQPSAPLRRGKVPQKIYWEGNILNKISKKIVALATMAAFVLTLVPAAAFAADTSANIEASVYKVVDGDTAAAVNETVETTFEVNQEGGTVAVPATMNGVRVWATKDDSKVPTTLATFYDADENELTEENPGVFKNQGKVLNNGEVYYVSFAQAGTYTIHAGVPTDPATIADVSTYSPLTTKEGERVITVSSDVAADSMTFHKNQGSDQGNLPIDEKIVTLDLSNVDFTINGTDSMNLIGKVLDENDQPINGAKVTMEADRADIVLAKSETTTANTGEFNLSFKMKNPVNGNIYVTCGDVTYTIRVIGAQFTAANITTVEDGGYVMAGTDDHWKDNDAYRNFGDAVQFEITDQNGDAINGNDVDLTNSEPAFGVGNVVNTKHEDYVSIDGKPKKSDLEANDLIVVWDNAVGAYTLYYKDLAANAEDDLIPGEYTVTVSLANKKSATATFNVAEYGTTQDVTLSLQAQPISADGKKTTGDAYRISDEVTLGNKIIATANYVDENGLKIPATNVQYGFKGDPKVFLQINDQAGRANLVPDTLTNEALLGSVVTVQVFDASEKKLVEKPVTIVDSYGEYTLAFDPTQGDANKDNTVNVSVVDEDGDVVRVNGSLHAYIADQSNEDAKISVSANPAGVTNGKGTLTIYSDKETTVDIVVAVDTVNGPIYPATLEYTVGAEDPNAENTVVMTIGSTDYVVNNDIVKGDAAPYVDDAWRTMVPFRVLGETFGATVDWDQDAQSVTYIYGDTELVMTIGEDTYTINGEEFSMDTAPVLSGDRTYVPVRFVAEGLGYTVTPLYDAESGLTASVVFQK